MTGLRIHHPKQGTWADWMSSLSWRSWETAGAGRALSFPPPASPPSRSWDPHVRGALPVPGGKEHPYLCRWQESEQTGLPKLPQFITLSSHPSVLSRFPRTLYSASNLLLKTLRFGASLVAQWLRICLPMQGTRVRALIWEDPTCHGANRPVSHNYWACASGACAPQQGRPR